MIHYQNYRHFKLPITLNPLEYGKLIYQNDNKYIIQINDTNVIILDHFEEYNIIKLYKKGDFMFEYNDHKTSNHTFIRTLNNLEFTFNNNQVINIKNNLI